VEVEDWDGHVRETVRHPGAAAVVALTDAGDVVLVRQRREAVRDALLEIPAGILDVEGEPAADTALRELGEESGFHAGEAVPLATILTSPGFADERVHLFLATGAERRGDPEEGLQVETMPLEEAVRAVEDGRITDAKSAVGILLVARGRSAGR
jgi:8-oxo-dGTP pyrophosphatase MutT (NUDIX family)